MTPDIIDIKLDYEFNPVPFESAVLDVKDGIRDFLKKERLFTHSHTISKINPTRESVFEPIAIVMGDSGLEKLKYKIVEVAENSYSRDLEHIDQTTYMKGKVATIKYGLHSCIKFEKVTKLFRDAKYFDLSSWDDSIQTELCSQAADDVFRYSGRDMAWDCETIRQVYNWEIDHLVTRCSFRTYFVTDLFIEVLYRNELRKMGKKYEVPSLLTY